MLISLTSGKLLCFFLLLVFMEKGYLNVLPSINYTKNWLLQLQESNTNSEHIFYYPNWNTLESEKGAIYNYARTNQAGLIGCVVRFKQRSCFILASISFSKSLVSLLGNTKRDRVEILKHYFSSFYLQFFNNEKHMTLCKT